MLAIMRCPQHIISMDTAAKHTHTYLYALWPANGKPQHTCRLHHYEFPYSSRTVMCFKSTCWWSRQLICRHKLWVCVWIRASNSLTEVGDVWDPKAAAASVICALYQRPGVNAIKLLEFHCGQTCLHDMNAQCEFEQNNVIGFEPKRSERPPFTFEGAVPKRIDVCKYLESKSKLRDCTIPLVFHALWSTFHSMHLSKEGIVFHVWSLP